MCMYWTCGQCCVFCMWLLKSNIAIIIRTTDWTCSECCVFHMWVVWSKIVIGVYVLDRWSVLFVMYDGGMF